MGFRKGTELLERVWRRHSLRRWCQLVQTTSSPSSSSWPSNDDNDDVGQGFNKDQIKPDTGSIGNKGKQMLRPRICSPSGLLPATTKDWDALKPKDLSIWHPALAREKKKLDRLESRSRNLSKKPDWANPKKKRDWKQNLLKWMFYERLEVPLPLVAGIRNRYLTAESEISDEIPVPRIIFCFSVRTFSGLYPRILDKCTSLISLYHGSDDFCAWD